jgi:tripartite-type tricarboxylate transporter receptor subunit TctC
MILRLLLSRSRGKFWSGAAVLALATLVGALVSSSIVALAQTAPSYPSEPIRIIVPFGPAGGPDFSVRALQAVLQETIKQSIRVENRPGANSIIGTRAVATAPPDGYTLLGASSGFSTIGITTSQPGFDPQKDFAPVSLTARAAGYLLVVSAKSPFNSMADLVAGAKKSEVFYGSPGLGNTLHLVAALFADRAGAAVKHVPYPNLPDAVLATARGEVSFVFSTPPAVMGLLQSGELRALGYAGSEPLPELPAVPLISSFVRGFRIAEPWTGILAPARTPEPVIATLNDALRRAVAMPRYKTLLEAGSYRPASSSPEEFRAFLDQNSVDWLAAAQAAGVKAK